MVNLIVIVAAVLVAAVQFKQYRQFTQRLAEFGKGGEPLRSTELSRGRLQWELLVQVRAQEGKS